LKNIEYKKKGMGGVLNFFKKKGRGTFNDDNERMARQYISILKI